MERNCVAIVGTGGTGGNLVPLVSRMLSATYLDTTLLLIDGDRVEDKNLKRQPFTKKDVGMKKSRALVMKVGATYDCKVRYSDNFILSVSDLDVLLDEYVCPIVVGCVDNHKARKVLHEWFDKTGDCVYIDVANEDSWGDCFVSFKILDKKLFKTRGDMFPEVLLESNRSVIEMSCEETANESPQQLKTNSMAANVVFNALDSIMVRDRLPFYYSSFNTEPLIVDSKYVEGYNEIAISSIAGTIREVSKSAASVA